MSNPKIYTEADIQIVRDPIAMMRKRPEMYAGPKPWGRTFASLLMRDLIALGAMPLRLEILEGWWVFSAEKDWLLSSEGTPSLDPFFRMVPFGLNGFRSEILLTAFADAVVTWTAEGAVWISGQPDQIALPSAPEALKGRVLGFRVE